MSIETNAMLLCGKDVQVDHFFKYASFIATPREADDSAGDERYIDVDLTLQGTMIGSWRGVDLVRQVGTSFSHKTYGR